MRRRWPVVADLREPAGQLGELPREQQPSLLRGGRARADPGAHALAQDRCRELLDLRRRASMDPPDVERALLATAQRAELGVRHAEDVRCLAGDRELMQRVKEQVLGEMALGDRPQRPPPQDPEHPRRDIGAPGLHQRPRQLRRVGPPVLCGQLGDRVVVVAQLAPDVAPRDAEQGVQAPLVVGQPVVVDPVLGRQPVRRRSRRRERVERRFLGGACLPALVPRLRGDQQRADKGQHDRCDHPEPQAPSGRTGHAAIKPPGRTARLAFRAERQGPGGPSGFQNRQGVATRRLEGSTPRRSAQPGFLATSETLSTS